MKNIIVLKILKNVGITLFYIIIVFLFLFSISTLSRKSNDQVNNLFGIGFLAVETDSMAGDNNDSFNKGDLIFVKVLSDKDRDNLDINTLVNAEQPTEGKIVTFYDRSIGTNGALNTHRVIGVENNRLITQGDNVDAADSVRVNQDAIIAVYMGKLPKAGSLVSFMLTPLGFGLLVVLPFLLLLVYHGIMLTKHIFIIRENKLRAELLGTKEQEGKE